MIAKCQIAFSFVCSKSPDFDAGQLAMMEWTEIVGQTNRSIRRMRTEGFTSSVEDRLNIVRSEGDFSPRSSCPM